MEHDRLYSHRQKRWQAALIRGHLVRLYGIAVYDAVIAITGQYQPYYLVTNLPSSHDGRCGRFQAGWTAGS